MRRLLISAALCLTALPALARENYALLIGASQYPNLDERYWLKGPANDVTLVRTWLTTQSPVPFPEDHVTVLADGVQGADAPTLEAIRQAVEQIAAEVGPGDFVYLHFSGHGTQAPAQDPEAELDGLDELFLPVDIGPWSDEVGTVQNALVDDEIGKLIDSIRDKGADVWAVFDSCHSGTVTRGAPSGDEEVRTRQLPPEALGIEAAEEPATRGLDDPRAAPDAPFDAAEEGSGKGRLVAFFAAQTNEVTPEKNLPKGKPGRVPQGVFTYALFETLSEYPQASYRQIGQEVLRKYAVKSLARTTPMFEGDLDATVFSGTPGPRVAQWPSTLEDGSFTLPAGTLHGLKEGERLAVMASAADPTEAAIGFAEVTFAGTFTATATPATVDGKALPADLPKGLVLRRIAADLDFSLTVALPEAGSAGADALLAAQAALAEAAGPRITFVPAGAEADLRLAVIPDSPRPDAIWVLPSTGLADDLAATPSVGTTDKGPEDLAATLADTLGHMAKALNLLKLGAGVGGDGLDVDVTMLTRTPEDRKLRPLASEAVPRLVPEDEVHVQAVNHMDIPVDINVLYIGADYSITHWAAERMQPGDTLKKGLFKISDSVLGQERMVVVLTPAAPQSPVENLSFLAQDALELTRGGGSAFDAALRDAGFGETTRGAVALDDGGGEDSGPSPAILQLELRTVPAD